MLHKGYTKFIMPAGIMSSASINIIRSNPIISADLSGLSVICSYIIRMNLVYDKTDGGLNGFHRSTSLTEAASPERYLGIKWAACSMVNPADRLDIYLATSNSDTCSIGASCNFLF